MQKITANPKDTASLGELANIYFQAGDYKNSALFSQKVVAIDPKNDSAWVALGAAQFNAVDQVSAQKSWEKAIAINPKNAEAHYDLGFLYLSSDKPDMAKAKKEWNTVIAIDPKSDLAKTVQTHLTSLNSPSPSAIQRELTPNHDRPGERDDRARGGKPPAGPVRSYPSSSVEDPLPPAAQQAGDAADVLPRRGLRLRRHRRRRHGRGLHGDGDVLRPLPHDEPGDEGLQGLLALRARVRRVPRRSPVRWAGSRPRPPARSSSSSS